MKRIRLTQGEFAIVDDADFEYLNQWKWYFKKYPKTGYATRAPWENGKQYTLFMHTLILKTPKGMCSDHINGNGLDNRKSNLRTCTYQQNAFNRKKRQNMTSRFKGVNWHKGNRKWEAGIKINGRRIYLGEFDLPIEAAMAYKKAALEYHGEFARLEPVFT